MSYAARGIFLTKFTEDVNARSIYVSKVNRKITAKVLRIHFQRCGDIRGIKIVCKIFDNNVDNDIGHAFIEFFDESSVEDALDLDGRRRMGNSFMLHDEITREELKNHFQIYGNVLETKINDCSIGKYAFLLFATKEIAEHALQADNTQLGGRNIRVRRFPSDNSILIAGVYIFTY
ncbi:1771_t:CDS:2 [Dentiscutata erythropus]|uniref:1771_t:CDS:1 n=1 Tax=Dentiscutata erythropus TaxID=1348616 RepID=A0A9N9HZP2_9GLOM|nr:1771_t:CDS:2 [Dentiscutata erythropus]